MSSGDTRETVYLKTNAKENTQPSQGLELLDQRLDTISENHIPPNPYLLTIPSKRQFHLSEYQYREEFKEFEIGFKLEEREFQYLTFLTKGWEETIFSVINSEQQTNGTARLRAMASTNGGPKSAAKKISINDYNKKRSSLPPRSVNGSPVIDEGRNRATSTHLTSSSTGIKRSSDVLEKSKLRGPSDAPPAKKLKPSPRLGPSGSKSPLTKTKLTLPPPLSPTLPAFVERLLSKSNDVIHKAENIESPAPNKKTKSSNLPNLDKFASQESLGPKRNNVDSTTKPTSLPSKPILNGTYGSPSISQNKLKHTTTIETVATKVIPMVKEKSSPKPSVLVRLKIPQNRRKDVARLLKLSSRNTQERKPLSKTSSISQEDKKMSDRPSVAGKSAEKRPREDGNLDVQHEIKRSKSPAYQDQVAGKKLRESTPMIKEEVTTPRAAMGIGTPIPPTSASKGPRDKQTPSETGSSNFHIPERLEGIQKLRDKYAELGRMLKREGDKLSGPDMSPAQRKKAMAVRIEVILAFILSYTIGDEVFRLMRRAPKPDNTWNTIFGYMASAHQWVNDQPYLNGLLHQLEAICLMVVWRQRSEIAEQGDSMTLDKFKELRLQCEEAQRKFTKGAARLSVDDLQNEFPRTWKTKASLPLAELGYKMSKDNLDGDFYLPLTAISLPIEGVRAGKVFLAEWCKREGIEWTAKLDF